MSYYTFMFNSQRCRSNRVVLNPPIQLDFVNKRIIASESKWMIVMREQ